MRLARTCAPASYAFVLVLILAFFSLAALFSRAGPCVRARILSGLTKHARLPTPTAGDAWLGAPRRWRAWPFRFRCGVATVISRSRATADVPKQKKAPGGRSLSSPKRNRASPATLFTRALFFFFLPWRRKNCVVRSVRCTSCVFGCDLLVSSRRLRRCDTQKGGARGRASGCLGRSRELLRGKPSRADYHESAAAQASQRSVQRDPDRSGKDRLMQRICGA